MSQIKTKVLTLIVKFEMERGKFAMKAFSVVMRATSLSTALRVLNASEHRCNLQEQNTPLQALQVLLLIISRGTFV